jgi:glutaconate CoA-transferase, subunit B
VTMPGYSPAEMMIVASARQLVGERVCFVGIGPPNIACNLAKRTGAPGLELVYEAGAYGSNPQRLPLSIGDPTLVTGAVSITTMFELFSYYLQRGLVDVAFLGASQIDRWGNINTTVIGDYKRPKVRLPGSGGACEISINARKVFVIMPQSTRSFVEKVDFVTSVGHGSGPGDRERLGLRGRGPVRVITDLGVLEPHPDSRELVLTALHPGVTVEQAQEATGWELAVADSLQTSPEPTDDELQALRELQATVEEA